MKYFLLLAALLTVTSAFANNGYGSFYNASRGAYSCYQVDVYGRQLVGGRVNDSVCTVGYSTFYVSSRGAYGCYPVDRAGNKLGTSRVDNSYCQGGINGPWDHQRDDRYDRYDRRDDRRDDYRRDRRDDYRRDRYTDRRDNCGLDEFGQPIYNGYYNCR